MAAPPSAGPVENVGRDMQPDDLASQGEEAVTPPPATCPVVRRHGITVLWESSNIIADIIFVHGLGGHPQKTWEYGRMPNQASTTSSRKRSGTRLFTRIFGQKKTVAPADNPPSESSTSMNSDRTSESRGSQPSEHCYWPFDLIPTEFDNVRIITYGYDSNPSHFYVGRTVQMNISQHSQQLLQAISDARANCRGRPVIFVAHSLGGILVKNAICASRKYEQHAHQADMQDLYHSSSAIIFFGTPHHGANAGAYG